MRQSLFAATLNAGIIAWTTEISVSGAATEDAGSGKGAPRSAGNTGTAFVWIVDIRRDGQEEQSVFFGFIFLIGRTERRDRLA